MAGFKSYLFSVLFVAFSSGGSFFKGSQSNTFFLGEGDPRVLALSDHENVADSGGERVTSGVSDVDNIETTDVSISVDDDTDSTNVVTGGDHAKVASFEFNEIDDLTSGDVELSSVVDGEFRVGESEGSAVVGDDVGDLVGADSLLGDLNELVLSFFLSDVSEDESSLNVVEDSVQFTSLLDGDDVHETSGESGVLSDLAIDSDVSFLVVDDHSDFSTSQSVLKTVLQDDSERKGFSVFVGALRGLSGEDTTELVKHPALGSGDSL
jgi:hypothetical protein